VISFKITGSVFREGWDMSNTESPFKTGLIAELRNMFPGCVILINDPNYIQGIPDLLILWKAMWAALECKKARGAKRQPNQDYWVAMMDRMSFAAFIHPGNKEVVLGDLQHAFSSRRAARLPRPKQVPLDQLRSRKAG
jgi:hypothetical protein